jgi:hypothetical protein
MDWLYFFREKLNKERPSHSLARMYLRPYVVDEENQLHVGEIVSLEIYAMDKLLELKKDADTAKFYYEKLGGNDYNIENWPIEDSETDIYEANIWVYLACLSFTMDEIWEWVRKIFVRQNYPFENFKEGTYNDFADTNRVMQLFSLKNVKKYEDTFGKGWWKKKDGQ